MKGRTSTKARLGIATAVLVGGSAIGVAAVATGNHGTPTNAQSSAYGFTLNFHHRMSEEAALSAALNQWGRSHQQAMTTLAQMVPMRTYSQVWGRWSHHHRTMFATQRGSVVFVNKRLMLVKSANGEMHLWWLRGTAFANVSSNATGMVAMTGNNTAGFQAMANNNMAPAMSTMAGSVAAANKMAAPVTQPTTITIQTGNQTITITITPSSATVTTPPTTPPATPPATPTPTTTGMASATPTPTTTGMATTQPVFTRVNGVVMGDMVFVAGERVHGQLIAKLVFFAAPATTVTPTPSASISTTTAPASTPASTPAMIAPSGVSGTHS